MSKINLNIALWDRPIVNEDGKCGIAASSLEIVRYQMK